MNEYTVGEEVSEFEKQIKKAREEKVSGISRIDPNSRRRVEMLLQMYRSEKEIEHDGIKYVLQTLKTQEADIVIREASKRNTNNEFKMEISRQTLVRALKSIEGLSLSDFLGISSFSKEEQMEIKLDFIDQMDLAMSSFLMEENSKLSSDHNKKYAVKNDEDAKEVLEEIKK